MNKCIKEKTINNRDFYYLINNTFAYNEFLSNIRKNFSNIFFHYDLYFFPNKNPLRYSLKITQYKTIHPTMQAMESSS